MAVSLVSSSQRLLRSNTEAGHFELMASGDFIPFSEIQSCTVPQSRGL